jgi:S1-C subfamily serine protease
VLCAFSPGDTSVSTVLLSSGVITNERVVRGHPSVQLATGDDRHVLAYHVDQSTDLILLPTHAPTPSLKLAPSGQQRQGDTLLVLGYRA